MEYAVALLEAIGDRSMCVSVGAARLTDLPGRFPPGLVQLWQNHGWCAYAGGLFWTIDPDEVAEVLREWPTLPAEAYALARDGLGNLFLSIKGEVHRLDIHHNRKDVIAMTIDFFLDMKIFNPSFKSDYLEADLFRAANARLGPLGPRECYAYFPALAMGGTERIESLRKVSFLEHLAFLAQTVT